MKEENIGTSFDSWLDEEGIRQEVTTNAIKRVLAHQVVVTMEKDGLTRTAMARRMGTSLGTLDRLLDTETGSVTLTTLQKAATAIGREVRIDLV